MTEQQTPEEDIIGPGRQLAALREAKGMSQQEAARALFLSKNKIINIEKDDYSGIEPVFACGYLCSYAKLLGADPEEFLAKFETLGIKRSRDNCQYNSVITRAYKTRCKRKYVVWIVGLLVVILLILLIVLWLQNGSSNDILPASLQQMGVVVGS